MGVNFGVAFKGISFDKPLVPCVILYHKDDSIELDTSGVKDNEVNKGISVPSNITTKSNTWDSIILSYDVVEGAEFYQIEIDKNKLLHKSTTNEYTKAGLLPDTEHCFRVRTVKDNSVSEWSNDMKGKTIKAPEFKTCVWEECPDHVWGKYSIDANNHRIATKVVNSGWCAIIGNTPLLLNKITFWSIKILKSKDNNGRDIYIGVAPSDINQDNYNYKERGWYFNCYSSKLYSGPPHNCRDKEYGPIKEEWNGKYFRTGDNIGVVMDTTKGDLSFVLNGMNYGVAYERIPLDKPLVPCVILGFDGDSIELIT